MTALALVAALFMPATGHAQNSIKNAPQLSSLLVHHYECRIALQLSAPDASKELKFDVSPNQGGHTATEVTLSLNEDQVVANANNQGLMINWTRGGQAVASVMTMIRKQAATHQVLIVSDPSNLSNRVDFDCATVTFSDLKGAKQ